MATKSLRDARGELVLDPLRLLAWSGYHVPLSHQLSRERYLWDSGVVALIVGNEGQVSRTIGPFALKEVQFETRQMLTNAREWMQQEMNDFYHRITLNDWQIAKIWSYSLHPNFKLFKHTVGEPFHVTEFKVADLKSVADKAWSVWEWYGAIRTHTESSVPFNEFTLSNVRVTFANAGAVYSAGGINFKDGLDMVRELHVGENT